MPDREMYYNISNNISNISNISHTFHSSEMLAEPEVPEPACSGRPFGSASPESGVCQEDLGVEITPTVRFEWITAQWAWGKQKANPNNAVRLSVSMTFMLPEEIGTRQRPHRITFKLTDRLREFQATNPFQKHVKSLAILADQRWIGKARITQRRGETREAHHRHNIPDLVMTAAVRDGIIHARLYSPQQVIDLVFDQELTERQQQWAEGAAVWGRIPRRRNRDEFYDWIRHA